MPNLKEIKNRIVSVKSTQKITKAMKMISTARLSKAKISLQNYLDYTNSMLSFTNSLIPLIDKNTETRSKIIKNFIQSASSKTLTLVISTDKGLCGALNTFLFKELKNETNVVFPIGKKAFEYTKSRFLIPLEKPILTSKPEYHHQIVETILAFIKENDIGKLKIIFPEFISVMMQKTKTENFPNFSNTNVSYYEIEGCPIQTLELALHKTIASVIHLSLAHLLCSEHSSRMVAMDNATNNAKGRIKALTLAYNKARQAKITNEILEIVSGSGAV